MKLFLLMFLSIAPFAASAGIVESISRPLDVSSDGEVAYRQVKVSCVAKSEPRFIHQLKGVKDWCVAHNLSACSSQRLTAAKKACRLDLPDLQGDNVANSGQQASQKTPSQVIKEGKVLDSTPAKDDAASTKSQVLALELRKLEIDQQKLDLRKKQLDLLKKERALGLLNSDSSLSASE